VATRSPASRVYGSTLEFSAGVIADAPLTACDVLIALHACDTATDDALARGIAAGARLLVVSPCCQKELRPQLQAPPVLADALQHGIFQERQAEFVTDALRAQLLEWAGFRTKVFEFISTEHTAKNLMIAGIRVAGAGPTRRCAGPAHPRFRRLLRHSHAGPGPPPRLRFERVRCQPRRCSMNWANLDWAALDRLREKFLHGGARRLALLGIGVVPRRL
jgi:hypothetical protein